MINKYTNKQRGLLAVIMAMVMVFAGAAFVAAEVDANTVASATEETGSVSLNDGSETTYYHTFEEAWTQAMIKTTSTITLLKDTVSNGVTTGNVSGKTVTVDLDGHILTMGPNGAGSENTQTQGFQLIKGNTITFKDGTITSDGVTPTTGKAVKMLIQNYSDLTLENVTLDGRNLVDSDYGNTTLSSNCGVVSITGNTTIYSDTDAKDSAIDVCAATGSYIAGTQVTITAGKVIGNIVMSYWNTSDLSDTIGDGESSTKLNIAGGSVEGDVIIGNSNEGSIIAMKSGMGIDIVIPETIIATNTIEYYETTPTWTGFSVTDLKAGSGGITISEGSYVLEGVVDLSSNTTITGDVTLENVVFVTTKTKNDVTSSGSGVIDNNDKFTATGKITIKGNVVIPAGVSIDAGSIEVATGASLNFGGYTEDTIDNKGTIIITTLDAEIGGVIGDGFIDTSGVASEGTLSGTFDTNTDFTQNQIITITGDTYLVEDTIFTFSGKLIIPEGVTLYIQDTAKVVIDTYAGYLENNGTIVVESKCGSLEIRNQANAVNNGTILLDYTAVADDTNQEQSMIIDSKFTNNGVITVGEDSAMVILSSGFVNSADAVMDVYGIIEAREIINNAGTINLDGIIGGWTPVNISLTSEDAVVNIVSIEEKNIDMTSLINISNGIEQPDGKTYNGSSIISVSANTGFTIGGIQIGASLIEDEEDEEGNTYDRFLVIEGQVVCETVEGAVAPTYEPVGIDVAGDVMVDGELALGAGVAMDITADAELLVTGKVTSVKGSILTTSSLGTITNEGTITVTGMMITENQLASTVNAAYYSVAKTTTTPETHNYTTLDQAVTAGATKIFLKGANDIKVDVAIPSGTTVTTENGSVTIVSEDVSVKFMTGAVLKNSGTKIDVEGTLYVEDRKSALRPEGTINSEVVSEGEKDKTYTNLAAALAGAESGDVIKLSGYTEIDKDTTIPADVTVDTNGKNMKVLNDVTLTIDGTLFINGGKVELATAVPETETAAAKDAGAIVLNGTVKSILPISDELAIAGAYYSITASGKIAYYVEPVSVAAPKIATVDNMTMEIKAFTTDLALGDVSFTGTADKSATVKMDGKVNGNIALDLASVVFDGDGFIGTITNTTGTIALDGDAGSDLVITSSTKDDVKTLKVAGGFTPGSKKMVTVTGDVSFYGFNASPVTVDGNVKVIENSTISELTVNGTVTVDNGVTLNVTTKAEVSGTLAATPATDSKGAGKVTVPDLYLGLTEKMVTGAGAAISENVSVSGYMYVVDGSTFPADMVKDKKYVALYVEDALWMTVYYMGAGSAPVVDVSEVPVENVELVDWVDDKGVSKTKDTAGGEDTFTIDVNNQKLYAKINYDVYEVQFFVSEGIDDVYIDGVLVPAINGAMKTDVAAGQHTVSYTLANGYTGEAKMLVDGKEVSGFTFTTDGKVGTTYKITLQGIEKAPAEVGGGDAPVADKDEGMDLTDILLIVLVVLIVIMAIIVALRMMRS